MVSLKFGRYLGPDDVEKRLRGSSPATKEANGWTKETLDNGIFVNLSRVEFAEFSCLAQIALIVEGALRHRIQVSIALPLSVPSDGETAFIAQCRRENNPTLAESVTARILRRQTALNFMEHSGFISAIGVQHVPYRADYLSILRNYREAASESEFVIENTNTAGQPVDTLDHSAPKDYLLRQMFPLRWFTFDGNETVPHRESFATAVLALADLGIARADAQAIVGTILRELVENVARHAPEGSAECPPHALVGALLLSQTEHSVKPQHFRAALEPFATYAAQAGSPLLRIVVGDSGIGIYRRLAPHFVSHNADEVPQLSPPLQPSENILFWAFNKWSTSDTKETRHARGTRGLWLVQRFVRAYHGAITVRSETAVIGWSYESANEPTPLRDKQLRYLPGTILDISLLTHVPQSLPAPAPTKPLENFRFAFVFLEDIADFEDEHRDKLVEQLAKATPERHTCAVLVIDTVPTSSRQAEDLLIGVARIASELANQGAAAAIFTNVTFSQLETAKESLEFAIAEVATKDRAKVGLPVHFDPVLLIDALGASQWLAADPAFQHILNHLSANGAVEVTILANLPPNRPPLEFQNIYHFLRDHPDIVFLNNTKVDLRFRADDLLAAFVDQMSQQLHAAISQQNPTVVTQGRFRTPTLQCVTTWIDVAGLLQQLHRTSAACFAIARKRLLDVNIPPDTWMIKLDSTHSQIVQQLCTHLGLTHIWSVPRTIGSFDTIDSSRLLQGTSVLVFADLILTENTVLRTLTDLIRSIATPLAVLCVFDARRTRGHITCLGRAIPVLSLVDIDICCDDALTNIDPVMRRPLTRPIEVSKFPYMISPDKVFRWCVRVEGSLHLAHVHRSNKRHFTIYLNVARLLGPDSPYHDIVVDKLTQQLVLWYEAAGKQGKAISSLEVWFPGAEKFAKQLALILSGRIRSKLPTLSIPELREIPRAESGGRWVFPIEVDRVTEKTAVIIVDWGSLTTATTHQMMRLAAAAGASAVWTLVFLSQMQVEEEAVLRKIRSLAAGEPFTRFTSDSHDQGLLPFAPSVASHETPERLIEVKTVFFSAMNITFYEPAECPICEMRDLYARGTQDAPSAFLRAYAKETAQSLTEAEREDVFRRPLQDLFQVSLNTRDITRILSLRSHLQRAITTTSERASIKRKLTAAAVGDSISIKVAWVRLLFTESNWLNMPPLSFYEVRGDIARIALSVIDNPLLPEGIRRQAVSVLRAASKDTLVTNLFLLFKACVQNQRLAAELLFDVSTYLSRPYHDSPDAMTSLCDDLLKCSDYITKLPLDDSYLFQVRSTLAHLSRAAEAVRTTVAVRDLPPIQVWRALRRHYLEPLEQSHPIAVESYNVVILSLQALWKENLTPSRERLYRIADAWDECLFFLQAYLIPHLRQLSQLFLSEAYAGLTENDRARLERLVLDRGPFHSDRVSEMLHRFVLEPELFVSSHSQQTLTADLEWWYRMFLRIDPQLARDDSWLVRILHRCPANLAEVVTGAIEDIQSNNYAFQLVDITVDSTDVFCDSIVLLGAVRHLLENAVGPRHAVKARTAHPRLSIMSISDGLRDVVTLRMLNDQTEQSAHPGGGINRSASKLAPFGAEISGRPRTEPWTYEALIRIRRW